MVTSRIIIEPKEGQYLSIVFKPFNLIYDDGIVSVDRLISDQLFSAFAVS